MNRQKGKRKRPSDSSSGFSPNEVSIPNCSQSSGLHVDERQATEDYHKLLASLASLEPKYSSQLRRLYRVNSGEAKKIYLSLQPVVKAQRRSAELLDALERLYCFCFRKNQ